MLSSVDLFRGAAAGAIGGIVGGAAKLAAEAIAPPRPPGRKPPPGILVADLVRSQSGRELTDREIERAASTIHWIFSVLSGAGLGVAVEIAPKLEGTEGIPFGVVIWAALHETLLPILGATPPLPKLPIAEQANEFVTHCLFGFSVERTRRAIRPLLGPL